MKRSCPSKRLLIAVILSSFAAPILSAAVLGPIRTNLASDIMTPQAVLLLLAYLCSTIDIAAVFTAYACSAYALIRKVLVIPTLLLVSLSIPFAYFLSGMADALVYSTDTITASYLLFIFFSCLIEFIRYAFFLLVVRIDVKRSKKSSQPDTLELLSLRGVFSRAGLVCMIIPSAILLAGNIGETVSLIKEYGAPESVREIMTLSSPYFTTAIYAVLGYFLIYAVLRVLMSAEGKEEK